jgi:CcmD family protein
MKNSIYKIMLFISALFLPFFSMAQQDGFVNQLMRTSDKMFVVVIVVLIIFAGIVFFLISLDKRLKKLEDNAK